MGKNEAEWELRLFVVGMTPAAERALANIKDIAENNLGGDYNIEVIDLRERPQLAEDEQIFAVPTLVRKLPEPLRKVVGDLSNTHRVLVGLDIQPRK